MTDVDVISVKADVLDEHATREIAQAVGVRHSIARKYVVRLRRRHPDASPAELVELIERHYVASITAAGVAITVGSIAATVGISLIPAAGAAVSGAKAAGQHAVKEAAKATAKQAAKAAAKNIALDAAKGGAAQLAAMLPAGEQQLQFEITAVFGLAIADIHGMRLDQEQAQTLVYGLTNERVSQQQIATMAADVARDSAASGAGLGRQIAEGHSDWSHWATTLADSLPDGAAQRLLQTVQTGHLEPVREAMSGKQRATIEYGVGAIVGGVGRFMFGREVVDAARVAFPGAPAEFPAHLAIPAEEDDAAELNRALAALEEAASTTGDWIAGTAGAVGGGIAAGAQAVGSGVATTASSVTRSFRSVDLDGDGVPDEARALTVVKDAGGAVVGLADSMGGRVVDLFGRRKRA